MHPIVYAYFCIFQLSKLLGCFLSNYRNCETLLEVQIMPGVNRSNPIKMDKIFAIATSKMYGPISIFFQIVNVIKTNKKVNLRKQ